MSKRNGAALLQFFIYAAPFATIAPQDNPELVDNHRVVQERQESKQVQMQELPEHRPEQQQASDVRHQLQHVRNHALELVKARQVLLRTDSLLELLQELPEHSQAVQERREEDSPSAVQVA